MRVGGEWALVAVCPRAHKKQTMYETNRFTDRDRTTKQHHDYLKAEYKKAGYKSAAAFLESILEEHIKPNLFKQKRK